MSVAAGYIRKNLEVEAVKVSFERLQDIAMWCGGTIKVKADDGTGSLYIRVRVARTTDGSIARAHVGDWIVKVDGKFKVLSDEEFVASYKPVVPDPEKYKAVLRLVKFAMLEQDSATYHGKSADMGAIAEQITRKILEIA